MIDIETEVFSAVSEKVREQYPEIFMTGEYVKSPSSFPCVSLIETDNQIYRNTRTSGCIENHAQVVYEVNVYSNKQRGKRLNVRKFSDLLTDSLKLLGLHEPL